MADPKKTPEKVETAQAPAEKVECLVALQRPGATGGTTIETVSAKLAAGTITAALQDETITAKVGKGGHVQIVSVTPV